MKIFDLLGATSEELLEKKKKRIGNALKRGQETLIDKLESKKDEQEAKVSKLLEFDLKKFDIEKNTWNEEYQAAVLELTLIEQEIKVARKTKDELFSDAQRAEA